MGPGTSKFARVVIICFSCQVNEVKIHTGLGQGVPCLLGAYVHGQAGDSPVLQQFQERQEDEVMATDAVVQVVVVALGHDLQAQAAGLAEDNLLAEGVVGGQEGVVFTQVATDPEYCTHKRCSFEKGSPDYQRAGWLGGPAG